MIRETIQQHLLAGGILPRRHALDLAALKNPRELIPAARQLRDLGHGDTVTYSAKVFIPLTKLCRDVCHYCTFAQPPGKMDAAFLRPEQILNIARAGADAGCREALFTLGDKPELRYRAARAALADLGHDTTLSYLADMADLVFRETGLLPHINAGVMTTDDIAALRRVSVSQGLMLETLSDRLAARGGPHFGSPDKKPAHRLATIETAGALSVPFTSGLLIGIGEARRERIEALLALRGLHERHGHIQEVIIQPFRAKPQTRMATAPDAPHDELIWTIAAARLILGAGANIQTPPNLSPREAQDLIAAGINDWGGVSPVTPDHVNPEAPWPALTRLAEQTEAAGKVLSERLAVYPSHLAAPGKWLDDRFHTALMRAIDATGLVKSDDWAPGQMKPVPANDLPRRLALGNRSIDRETETILSRALDGETPGETEIVRLFQARGASFEAVLAAADDLRRSLIGDTVTYVINRNINYTNICSYKCSFCAFSKGRLSDGLRGEPYRLPVEEIEARAIEAWDKGATEICLQGGIHPDYSGETYLEICRRLKARLPDIHLHGFTPLEIAHGARTLGLETGAYLDMLIEAGLGSLPGTAAEILDDEVRAIICPDKLDTQTWLDIMQMAHERGLKSTATIMFGHVDRPIHWARHLLRIRQLQENTGGFSEFVPLPFVHMAAPAYLRGETRTGPSFRECLLMHATARLVFHEALPNIQASWVKLGPDGVTACLNAGVNDLGGTLMNETITRSAGAAHGQEMPPDALEDLITKAGRYPRQRTTLYATVIGGTGRQLRPADTGPAVSHERGSELI
jgi:FO synthase